MKIKSIYSTILSMTLASPLLADQNVFPGFPTASGQQSSSQPSNISASILGRTVSPSSIARVANSIDVDEITLRGAAEIAVYKNAASSVVLIVSMDSTGTGGVISDEGLIVTNWHVVEDAPQVAIVLKPAGLTSNINNAPVMSAKIVHTNREKDLALLKLQGNMPTDLRPIELGSLDNLEIGADTHAIGHPSGFNWTYTKGFVSSYRKQHEWFYEDDSEHVADVIQTQTPINPGNSGGPLLNNEGQMIGVNSYTSEGQGLNFAVSVDEVRLLLDEALQAPSGKEMKCEGELIFSGRDEEDTSDIERYDRDCDGIVDLAFVTPDDVKEPIYVIFDDNQDGTADGYVLDENRDSNWNVSYWDSTGDGEMDSLGKHPDGELYPTEYSEISES